MKSGVLALGRCLKAIDSRIGLEPLKLAVVFASVYFVQGMGGLSTVPLLFFFKDTVHLSASELQYFTAITGVAWLVKPVFGLISDRFPLLGYRRKSYLVLMATLAAISWWALALMVHFHYYGYTRLVLIFNLSAFGYAFVDVVCDGLMVERGQRLKKEDFFVNVQFFSLGVAGLIAGLCSGRLQTLIRTNIVGLDLVLVVVGLIPLLSAVLGVIFIREDKWERSATDAPSSSGDRIDMQAVRTCLCSRTFWMLSLFIFAWRFSPSFGAVMQYFEIDVLRYDEEFMGAVNAVSSAVFPVAVLLYGVTLKSFPSITTRQYLYGSVVISLGFYGLSWLYFVPETVLKGLQTSIPGAKMPILWWIGVPLASLAAVFVLTKAVSRMRHPWLPEAGIRRWSARLLCLGLWATVFPGSVILSLWLAGVHVSSLELTFRTLHIFNTVFIGYGGIASFLIPMAIAAKLAPRKAEAVSYAFFMSLANASGNVISNVTGGWMFDVLKDSANLTPWSDLWTKGNHGILLVMFFASIILVAYAAAALYRRRTSVKSASVALLLSAIAVCVLLAWASNGGRFLLVGSYRAILPLLGDCSHLGAEAYRGLILRFSLIVGASFSLLSVLFVWLLPASGETSRLTASSTGNSDGDSVD